MSRFGLQPFELFNYLYNDGDSSFLDQCWFSSSTEFKYSRYIFILASFLLRGEKLLDGLNISRTEAYKSEISLLINTLNMFFSCDNNDHLSSIDEMLLILKTDGFCRISGIQGLVAQLGIRLNNEKDILNIISGLAFRFYFDYSVVDDENSELELMSSIDSYLFFAYSIDYLTWEFITSEYINIIKEKGNIETDITNIVFDQELESLFFLLINPCNVCPCTITLLLLYKSKLDNFIGLGKSSHFRITKYIIDKILSLINDTLTNMSPDLAELSFSIIYIRVLTSTSVYFQLELNRSLLHADTSTVFKMEDPVFAPPHLIRFILNSFSSIEELWIHMSKNEILFQSILTIIPSFELSISIIALKTHNLELKKKLLLLVSLFSLSNSLSIDGVVSKSALNILKCVSKSTNDFFGNIVNYLLFPSNNSSTGSSSLYFSRVFDLLFNKVHDLSISTGIIFSMFNLLRICGTLELSDQIIFKFLESFPKLIISCREKSYKTTTVNDDITLIDLIDNNQCFFLSHLFWLNPNLITIILKNLNINLNHILPFIYSISVVVTNIQNEVNGFKSFSSSSTKKPHNTKSLPDSKAVCNSCLFQLNVKKYLLFLMKTSNLDNIILAILNFLSEWIKGNRKTLSIELVGNKYYSVICNTSLRTEIVNNYQLIFFLYLISRTMNYEQSGQIFIKLQLQIIPWRGLLRWINFWRQENCVSILKVRVWKVLFSEIMAILIPESFFIPSVPVCHKLVVNEYFLTKGKCVIQEKICKWLSERKYLIDDCKEITEISDSTINWLELFYMEPNATFYSSIEMLFSSETNIGENISGLFSDLFADENKLKNLFILPESCFGTNFKYFFGEASVEILCNICLMILNLYQVIKDQNLVVNCFESIHYEVFCLLWNKVFSLTDFENRLTVKQLSMFVTAILGKNDVTKHLIENGIQYNNDKLNEYIHTFIKKLHLLAKLVCHINSQTTREQYTLPKIADNLDKLLDAKTLIESWGRYNVMKRERILECEIENQIIHCTFLLLWLSNIVIEPRNNTSDYIKDHSKDNFSFLPVADKTITKVFCITQEIIKLECEKELYSNLIENFSLFLESSSSFIITISASFPQIRASLLDTINVLRKSIKENNLYSNIFNVLTSIKESINDLEN